MKLFFLLIFSFAMSVGFYSHATKVEEHKKTTIGILDKYAKAKSITAEIEKIDQKLTLGTKSSNAGVIKFSGGKFNLVLQGEKKTELFFQGNKLTLVDYPDQDFDKDGARKVTHIRNKTPPFLKSLVNLFSNSKNFFKEFKVMSSSQDGNILTLDLNPAMEGFKDFKLNLNTKSKTIESIRFVDDVETQTSIAFKSVDFKKTIPKSTFEFKALKTDQEVTQ